MKKTIALLAAMMLATSAIVADETTTTTTTSTTEESAGTKLKNALSEFVTDTSNTVTSSVKKKQIVSKLKNYVGTWTFANGNDKTVFVINSDVTMTLTQSDGTNTTKWTGGVTAATSSEFTFTAAKKEVSGASGSSAENVTASWLIKYKKVDTNELKIVSDDIPNDTNDFDFSNATLVLRASE